MTPLPVVDVNDWAALMDPESALSHAISQWLDWGRRGGEPDEQTAKFGNRI